MYWKVSRKFINKFNLEPAGSKGTWTLDSYQLLSYVFGSAESCLGVQDWYRELVDDCRSVLAVRMFSRHWRDITKDMVCMYRKEVLSRIVVTKSFVSKSFVYSEYLKKGVDQ
ncbi:UNVERIFIED_CONTAM: Serine/threonine-protein phosphatase 2A activator [Trichonephila clavipes]